MRKLIVLIILISNSNASIEFDLKNSKKQADNIKNNLQEYKGKLITLSAEISSIEKDLGKKNNDYLSRINQIETINNEIIESKSFMQQTQKNSQSILLKTKKALNLYLLAYLDEQSEQELVERKVYEEGLKELINNLKLNINNYNEIQNKLGFLEGKLSELKLAEENLHGVLLDLEERKRVKTQEYIQLNQQKENTESKIVINDLIEKTNAQKKIEKIGSMILNLPLNNFTNAKFDKKGISLTTSNESDVIAPQSGKIVYSSALSTYGNLIIIEHKEQLRSVILGDFKLLKKRGDNVEVNELIGKFKKGQHKVYFEIRKQNKAQKISQWLDGNSLQRVL